MISSDKAVRPTNIMGASKRIAELLVLAFSNKLKKQIQGQNFEKIFTIVRFGNVIGSSGSVVPHFKKQILNGGPITLTHQNIIRYFMTIKEAVQLVIQAASISKGGDILLLDLGEPIKIYDLAEKMILLSGKSIKSNDNLNGDIEIITTGLRPGEKLYEELLISGKSEKTSHPLIFRALDTPRSYKAFWGGFDKLIENLKARKQTEVLKIVAEILPEWEISSITKKLIN